MQPALPACPLAVHWRSGAPSRHRRDGPLRIGHYPTEFQRLYTVERHVFLSRLAPNLITTIITVSSSHHTPSAINFTPSAPQALRAPLVVPPQLHRQLWRWRQGRLVHAVG